MNDDDKDKLMMPLLADLLKAAAELVRSAAKWLDRH